MRIVEPFLKAHLALWLVEKGAEQVTVSVDGAEPTPLAFRKALLDAGYIREPLKGSVAAFTGCYSREGSPSINCISQPGPDIKAEFPAGRVILAECKGEPTQKGIAAGQDRTSFYTAIGQLIIAAGEKADLPDEMILGLPDTPRIRELSRTALGNPLLQTMPLSLMLVNGTGRVEQL